jgi:hypothetical protein
MGKQFPKSGVSETLYSGQNGPESICQGKNFVPQSFALLGLVGAC